MRRLSDQNQAGITDEIEERGEDTRRPLGNTVARGRKPLRCLTDSVKSIAIFHGRDQWCKPYSQYCCTGRSLICWSGRSRPSGAADELSVLEPQLIEAVIDNSVGQQILIRARFAQLAFVQDEDAIHVLNGREAGDR